MTASTVTPVPVVDFNDVSTFKIRVKAFKFGWPGAPARFGAPAPQRSAKRRRVW